MEYYEIGDKLKEMDLWELLRLYDFLELPETIAEMNTALFNAMIKFKDGTETPEKLFRHLMSDIVVSFECYERRQKEQKAK